MNVAVVSEVYIILYGFDKIVGERSHHIVAYLGVLVQKAARRALATLPPHASPFPSL